MIPQRHLTEDYVVPLVHAAQDGSEDAKTELVRIMRPVVRSLVHTEGYTADEQAEQESSAWVGVWEAVARFSTEHAAGKDFKLVAWYRIRHHVSEWCARNSGGIPMPRSSAWAKGQQIDAALDIYAEDNPDRPFPEDNLSDKELDRITGVNNSRSILQARATSWPIEFDDDAGAASSAEDEYLFETDQDLDRSTVLFMESLDELDPDEWYSAALSFCDDHDLPEAVAARMVEVKEAL